MESVLFHCREMESLAKTIAGMDRRIALGGISWNRFADKFPNIYIEKVRSIRRLNVAFLASFESPEVIFEQWSAMCALPRMGAQRFTIILPYFPTGTMERVDDEGQVATAKTMARLLSIIPLCGEGPADLVTYDIHALQERFYFGDNVVPRMKSAMKYLKRRLAGMEDVAIVFPDYGAYKRFKKMFEGYSIVICNKERLDGDNRKVTIVEGGASLPGKNAIIIDDVIKSGGTIIECGHAVLDAGAKSVSAYATHGAFPEESWKKFLGSRFEHVWITDSCPLVAEIVKDKKPFEIISLAESLAHVILDEDDRDAAGAR